MLIGGGGGSISVEPAVLDAMAKRISGAASSTGSARGNFSGAASAADGCAEPAAGSFGRLQSLLAGALAVLDASCGTLSQATAGAATAYQTTDASQMPMTIQACPSVP